MGVTGGWNIPTADMQNDGTFMAGGNYLPKEILPENWNYNSGNYFVNLTFLPFVELAYRCTLLRGEFKAGNKLQQDRSVSVRLRPLNEGRYWPALVVGSNDAFTTGEINALNEYDGSNRFFSSIFAVTTKHVQISRHDLGLTVGMNMFTPKNSRRKGLFAGINYTPSFCNNCSLIAEYDANAFNVGIVGKIFYHFSLYTFCHDFKAVSGGLRYEFILIR
ncbi:MAG: YjbH domain-containing protein [Massilibacteroides sp.]|nr:YjbH domain-containing protein [Massilibacteroides sp.]MDD4115411.1 YjbH domain-containing protein [Massilibacteroides sp.]MDD4660092.1 YjbH domain-containing protein [Massilibacteroides sp.]